MKLLIVIMTKENNVDITFKGFLYYHLRFKAYGKFINFYNRFFFFIN